MESYYKTADYSELFLYFFEAYRMALTKGFATDEFSDAIKQCPFTKADNGIVFEYMKKGLSLLPEAYPPSVLSLLLERLYVEQSQKMATTEQAHMMELARRLIKSLHVWDLQTMFDTSRLWSDETMLYATTCFYPALPQDVQDKYNFV